MSALMETSEPNDLDKIEYMTDNFSPTHLHVPKAMNNTHHLVVAGILIVLFTLYITATAIQRTSLCFEDEDKGLISRIKNGEEISEADCSELDVFVTDEEGKDKNVCGSKLLAKESIIKYKTESDVTERNPETNKKNILDIDAKENGIKPENEENDIDHSKLNNKTLKLEGLDKYLEPNKNENIKKKSSTAEPIIYLFALVFIYLLIKAASDINQHYKSQTKGDKRLRRCSLQSYAQTHKQDRRASKETPLIAFKHRQHLLEQRSQSLDRFTEPLNEDNMKKTEILNNLRKYISIEEPMQDTFQTGQIFGYTTMIIDPTIHGAAINSVPDGTGNMSPNRRCSITSPSKFGSTSSIGSLNRRSSIVAGNVLYGSNSALLGSLGGSFDSADSQFPENKRRVRMINRH